MNMHSKCINILLEPTHSHSQHIATLQTNRLLWIGTEKINMCLHNMGTKEMKVDKTAIIETMVANAIPVMLDSITKKAIN